MVRDLWGLFLKTRQPLVAALHGYVLGSGLEMALCCDVRIADQNAIFGLPEVNLGMIPAAGGTQTLPRAIGRSKATEILLTGSKLSSAEALSCGLVHYVVETAELMQAAEAKARKIAEYDLAAARFAKEAVLQGSDMDLDQGLQLERRLSLRLQTGRH
jgi:enoyl-CoA hydratase